MAVTVRVPVPLVMTASPSLALAGLMHVAVAVFLAETVRLAVAGPVSTDVAGLMFATGPGPIPVS